MNWSKWEDKDMKALIDGIIHVIEFGENAVNETRLYAQRLSQEDLEKAYVYDRIVIALEEYVNHIRKPFNNYISSYLAYQKSVQNLMG